MVFKQRDIGVVADFLFQCDLHRMAGGVRCMDNAALTMTAFASQMKAKLSVFVACERDALFYQPVYRFPSVFDDVAGRTFITQSATRDQGVGNVLLMTVMRIEYCSNTALRPVAGAIE